MGNRGRGQDHPKPGSIRDIQISNIQASGAILPCIISGIRDKKIDHVTVKDLNIRYTGGGMDTVINTKIPDLPADYPEAVMFGRWLPSYGLFCRHISSLVLANINIWLDGDDPREAIELTDINHLSQHAIRINARS
ncbi:hypothetical protein [Amphibacillus marinus]|uniref:hypothetical protein n=1 Tax=Amphibacillus marinus TaxID=872970 RepID=UPI00115FC20A|nr:hypothetical protein [Amphibacillus marinus]